MTDEVTGEGFLEAEGIDGWAVVSDGACAFYRTGSFAESARFVQAMSELPGLAGHPPDVDLRPDGVTVRLLTAGEDRYGMSTLDVDVARLISSLARDLGLRADPSAVQSALVVVGAPDIAAVMPFWQAALGYDRRPDSPDEDLVDPRNRCPAFWFEQMETPRADGGGAIHLGIWMPYEQAEARVAAAIAAGGHVVRDDFAPAWWTLADAAGNEADISTIKHRE